MGLLGVFHTLLISVWVFITNLTRILTPKKRKSVDGQLVLVTGAGQGMGHLLAITLGKLGAKVIVVDKDKLNNENTKNIIVGNGGTAYSYQCNLANKDETKLMASYIRDNIGEVSILVNNAGVLFATDFMSLTDEQISLTFNVNIMAITWLIREFLPAMKERNSGHIVSIASMAGLFGQPFMTDYSATKHAVVGLMDALHQELLRMGYDGVKTTTVCPSFVTTIMISNPRTKAGFPPVFTPEEMVKEIVTAIVKEKITHTPLGPFNSISVNQIIRACLPSEVYDAAVAAIDADVDHLHPTKKKTS